MATRFRHLRARLWELGKGVNPMWSKYQARTERELPVVVLTPSEH